MLIIHISHLLQATMQVSVELFIIEAVVSAVQTYCQCDLQVAYVSQRELLCDEQEPNWVLLAADIVAYGEHSSLELVGYIQDWVTQGATSSSGGLAVIMFDRSCPAGIDPGAAASCPVSSPIVTCAEPTISSSLPSLMDSKLGGIPFLIIVALLATVIAMVAIIVCVAGCLLQRRSR